MAIVNPATGSDSEGAVSLAFRNRIKAKHGILIYLLKSGYKASMSESFLGHVKKNISLSCSHSGRGGRRSVRWRRFLQPVVDGMNETLITGTNIKRSEYTEKDFPLVLAAREGVTSGDPWLRLTTNSYHISAFSAEDAAKVFKFAIGDRVLLHRGHAKWKSWPKLKVSSKGAWGKKIFRVVDAKLRKSGIRKMTAGCGCGRVRGTLSHLLLLHFPF